MKICSIQWGEKIYKGKEMLPRPLRGITVVELCFLDNDGNIGYAVITKSRLEWDVYYSQWSVFHEEIMPDHEPTPEELASLPFYPEDKYEGHCIFETPIPQEILESPFAKVFLVAMVAAQKYSLHTDTDWKGDKEEASAFIAPYLNKELDECKLPVFEDENTYLSSKERVQKGEEFCRACVNILADIKNIRLVDEQHGVYKHNEENQWIYDAAELMLKYIAFNTGKADAGDAYDVQNKLGTFITDHVVSMYMREGILPEQLADLSEEELLKLKRNSEGYYTLQFT